MKRFLCLLALLATTAGCATTGAIAPESITYAPALQVDLSAMQRTTVGVYYRDLQVGRGSEVRRGSRITVHYAGFLPNGQQIEAVAPPTPPVEMVMGGGGMIRGWESGLMGMRPGGERQLVIPSELAYGSRSVGRIPPNSTLVFVVKLVSIR